MKNIDKVLILGCIFIQSVCPFVLTMSRGQIIDLGMIGDIKSIYYLFLFLLITFLNILFSSFQNYLIEKSFIEIDNLFDSLYLEKNSKILIGELEKYEIRKLIQEAETCKDVKKELLKNKINIFSFVLQITSYMIFLIFTNIYVFLICFVIFALSLVANLIISRKNYNFWPKYIARMKKSKYFSTVLTSPNYINEKKIFNYYSYFEDKYDSEFTSGIKENKKFGKNKFLFEFIQEFISILSIVLITALLIYLSIKGTLSIGMFITTFLSLNSMYAILLIIASNLIDFKSNKVKIKSWDKFLNLPEYQYSNDERSIIVKKISIRNLYFKYDNTDDYVINDFSFEFDVEKKYALIGENGCGKSTLIKLLLGFYKPTSGLIELDGVNIDNFSRNELNKIFNAVFQKAYIYPFTIKEMMLVHNDGTNEKINEAIKMLNLSNIEDKLETSLYLNDNGTALSGGEIQKLSIARVLLNKKQFIILDEPNSALDPISEVNIYNIYKKIFSDCCFILITHRLGAVKDVDNIIVMKDGKVHHCGSHDYLLKYSEYYAFLFNSQKELYNEKK